ncbi:MAG: MoaD/ThiS family protein [Pseudoalteromonas sp.]
MAIGNETEHLTNKVRLLFFGQLKERLQCANYSIDIKQATSIKQLKLDLVSLQPGWQEVLSDNLLLCAINQQMAQEQAMVKGGDEVAFFPPVTGG